MSKIIIIDKCSQCQYCKCTLRGLLFKKTEYCFCLNSTKTYTFDPNSQPRELTDLEVIPEWCQLKDAIPNLKELQYEYEKTKMLMKYYKKHSFKKE